jgi:hypothetical protein
MHLCVFVFISEQTVTRPIERKLIGFYNRDEKYLVRGLLLVFTWSNPFTDVFRC